MKVLTSRDPAFLKAAYAVPDIRLIDHDGFVNLGERFIAKTGDTWTVYLMTASRAHYKVGSFKTIRAAIFAVNR